MKAGASALVTSDFSTAKLNVAKDRYAVFVRNVHLRKHMGGKVHWIFQCIFPSITL